MEIKILGWESMGMKCPDYKFEFVKNDKVNLIQMNNGLGKTTLITLIKISLFGVSDLKKLNTQKAQADNNKALKSLVRADHENGVFKLKASFNGQNVSFQIFINKKGQTENEIIKFQTTDTEHGIRDGHRPLFGSSQFLTPEFGLNYIADAEETGDIFNPNKDSAEQTIDTLCQFNVLDTAITEAEKFFKRNVHKEGNKASTVQKEKISRKIKEFSDREQSLTVTLGVLKDRLQKREAELKEVEINLERKRELSGEYKSNKKELDVKLKNVEKELKDIRDKIYSCVTNPGKLSEFTYSSLLKFKNSLDAQKLPEPVGKEFFKELSERTTCICNRPIGNLEKESIIESSKSFLGQETTVTIARIKDLISQCSNYNYNLYDDLNKLTEKEREAQDLQNQILRNEKNADDGSDDREELAAKKEKLNNQIHLDNKEIEKKTRKNEKDEYTGKIPDARNVDNIDGVKFIINKLYNRLAEQTESINLRENYEMIKNILTKTKINAKEVVIEDIKNDYQNKLNELFPNDKVIIKSIGKHVNIVGEDGQSRSGSTGENVVASYIFMTEVMKRSEVKTPFIVDTPTGKNDMVKREIAGKIIPKIMEQSVFFIQPAEKFSLVPNLRNASDNKCSHITLTPMHGQNEDYRYKKWLEKNKNKVVGQVESSKGEVFVLKGEDVFDSYDMGNYAGVD